MRKDDSYFYNAAEKIKRKIDFKSRRYSTCTIRSSYLPNTCYVTVIKRLNSTKSEDSKVYKRKKINTIKLWLDFEIFQENNIELFKKSLFYSGKLKPNAYYLSLIKVRQGDIYYTAGLRQESLRFKDYNDKVFERFLELILGLLQKIIRRV